MLAATRPQLFMLFELWNQAKPILHSSRACHMTHLSREEEDRRLRHEFTAKILGREKSWAQLNRRTDVDLLRGALLAAIRPGDLNAQLKIIRASHKRLIWRLEQLMSELGKDRNYVQGIVERMNREGSLSSSDLDLLETDDLRKVVIALQKHKRRQTSSVAAGVSPARSKRDYILHPA